VSLLDNQHSLLNASIQKEYRMVIRNWKDAVPTVGHETAIIWSIFRGQGAPGLSAEEAPLLGASGLTNHMMQAGKEGDYHDHENVEQIYYFTKGCAKMKIDDQIYAVKEGDGVHLPPKTKHQLINDSDDWVEHLIISIKLSD
jgi:glyoxylate utilization-related uncharacterized protein